MRIEKGPSTRTEEEMAPTTSGTTKQNRETPRRLPGLHEKVEEYLHNLENENQSKETESVKLKIIVLDRLQKDANIVIKKAEKDGALVVLKTENYIMMGNKHLRDTETYGILENPALQLVIRESKLLVNRSHILDNPKKKTQMLHCRTRRCLVATQGKYPTLICSPQDTQGYR